MTERSPYTGQDFGDDKFWRSGVAEADPMALRDVYRKRFAIGPDDRIATAGSCFAQHIATHLTRNGFNVLDVEPPPPALSLEEARQFRYSTFSARYGNIYAVRHLWQLSQEAFGLFTPGEVVWTKQQRYFDALRPTVEPAG
ncbi:MAG: GSCFA domain-containing protein, partial [Rhodospirillaceae bacterium]|nr:GSCFA domain-containing protein [Rhodospirillaceae bacterium]